MTARNLGGKTLHVFAKQFVLSAGTIETTRLLLLMDRGADNRIFGKASVLGHYFQDHLKLEVAKIERHKAVETNRYFAYRYCDLPGATFILSCHMERRLNMPSGVHLYTSRWIWGAVLSLHLRL